MMYYLYNSPTAYVFPVDPFVLQNYFASDDAKRVFSGKADVIELLSTVAKTKLVIPERVLDYPSRHVFVAQKMW